MPNGISKRQQLRHEKILAELIRTVPGNDRCADCDALTPGSSPHDHRETSPIANFS